MARLIGRLRLSIGSPAGAILSELSDPSQPDVLAWLAVLSNEAPSSTTMIAGGGGAAEVQFNSVTNRLSRRVLGPTCKISSNRAAPLPSPAGRCDEIAHCARRLERRRARPQARTPRDICAPRQSVILEV
ncbi:hypothetical protein TIFTF001_022363 [Ficus carica]|uniref:Uncharacterized protein n=1 Tax=Ficus carica TaxID=3494 RepID=A0AA88DCR4_FICCA|nr:hypothetical protein TIFTF001_022363 [Ficus carica]